MVWLLKMYRKVHACTIDFRTYRCWHRTSYRISNCSYSLFDGVGLDFLRRLGVLFPPGSFRGPRFFSMVGAPLCLGASEMFVRQVANFSTKFGRAIAKTSKGSLGSLDFARAFCAVAKSSREVWELLQRDSNSVGPCAL